MIPVALDCETELIRAGCQAPPLVCVGVCRGDEAELYHHTEALPVVEELITNPNYLLIGDNVAFDFSVFAEKWPHLMPAIFQAYADDRVADTELREKLLHIAHGIYRKFERSDGEWVKLNYSLADLARRHLNVELKKGDWQLRFGELRDVPLTFWPSAAVTYAKCDPEATYLVWQKQELDRALLDDEFRQSRAGWWIQLMSCWGQVTDIQAVREFAARAHGEFDELARELAQAGLVTIGKKPKSGKKNKLVIAAYERLGVPPSFLRVKRNVKVVEQLVVAAYARLGKNVFEDENMLTEGGADGSKKKPKTDADVCARANDALLQKYADLSSLGTTLSGNVPLLESGTRAPIEVHYEVMLETGRTSSSPNVQNLPTDGWTIKTPIPGVRECFAPRAGHLFAVADYSQFELRTWSQVCIAMLGYSTMAEFLNAGRDPHMQMASKILNLSYDEASANFKSNPKGHVYKPRQASKSGNFGFPGGLGVDTFVEYARTNYGVFLYATPEEVRQHESDLGEYSHISALELREAWRATWSEAQPYLDLIGVQDRDRNSPMKQLVSNRYRGRVRFTQRANGYFQSLAADAAKHAGFLIARACYVDQNSPLFGARMVGFVHDEFLLEVADDNCAPAAAEELARLMVAGASPFLPDVPPVVEALLCRRWSKAAKPVRDQNGRLIPWDFSIALQEAA